MLLNAFIKLKLALVLFLLFSVEVFAQKQVSIEMSNATVLPTYDLQVEHFKEIGTYENDADSYVLINLNKSIGSLEDPEISIESSNEKIIPSFSGTISDFLKIFYDHQDSSFAFSLDLSLSSTLCNKSVYFEYSFTNNSPVTEFQQLSVLENPSTGALIGSVEAHDPDNDPITYLIKSTTPENDAFHLNQSTGEISVKDSSFFDHENYNSVELLIEISDGRLITEETISIEINDANESPVLTPAYFEVVNSTPLDATIGYVEAFDPDSDGLVYSITGGNVGNLFEIDSITGGIKLIKILDQELEEVLSLLIKASDGQLSDEEEVDISVTWITAINTVLSDIHIYPNPVEGLLQIETGSKIDKLFFTDISGKVYPVQLDSNYINMEAFSSGPYILHLVMNGETFKFKVLKK